MIYCVKYIHTFWHIIWAMDKVYDELVFSNTQTVETVHFEMLYWLVNWSIGCQLIGKQVSNTTSNLENCISLYNTRSNGAETWAVFITTLCPWRRYELAANFCITQHMQCRLLLLALVGCNRPEVAAASGYMRQQQGLYSLQSANSV